MRQEHHSNVVTSHTHARAKPVTAFVLLSQGKDSLCDRGDVSPKLRININPTRLLFESCNNYYVYIWLLYRYKCLTKNHTHVVMYVCTYNLPAWVPYLFVWVIGRVVRDCRVPLLRLTLAPFLIASAHAPHSLVHCCMQALITRRPEWAWST